MSSRQLELNEDSVVVRFLAGICRHDDYHSHPVYRGLVQQLASNMFIGLHLVHCAYECPSIMDSVKVDYSECDTIRVAPVVGFDWYATGYCISHFDERWELHIDDYYMGMEEINLLVKGLRSSPVAIGRIRFLHLSLEFLFFSQVITPLRKFCELHHLIIFIRHDYDRRDDEVILQQRIAPWSGLRNLVYSGVLHTNTLIPLLFQPSSLQELLLMMYYRDHVPHHELFPHENTNIKELTIAPNLLHSLAALIVNITSLTYLNIVYAPLDSDLPVLTNIVQSHRTLEVLEFREFVSNDFSTNLIDVAGNSRLKKLRLRKSDYNNLPPHIHEKYRHLLQSLEF